MRIKAVMIAALIGLVPVILMALNGYALFGAIGAYVCAAIVPISFIMEYTLEQLAIKLLLRKRYIKTEGNDE